MHRTKSSTFNDSQTFPRECDKKLWTAADKLRSNLDAAVYKHAVLGLIFLNYGEHTRLACSDGRPADRSSTSKPHKITSTGKLIGLIATIPFQHADLHAKDILGHAPKSSPANSSSASIGRLCALPVNSPLPRMATGMSPLPATFTRDQHPDLRADFVMANPPFNIKEWWDGRLEGDARWN